jgi:mono/diheme cytochrome c family protein
MKQVLVAAGALMFAAACNPGAYPVDVFKEMHYQGSQRRLEPDRVNAPDAAVSTRGGRPAYTYDEAEGLPNPLERNAQTLTQARQLYGANCAMCHGVDGRGHGPVAESFQRARDTGLAPVPPVDLTGDRVRARLDGQLYWIVTNGLGNMPAFRALLTEDDVWAVVHFIRMVQGA